MYLAEAGEPGNEMFPRSVGDISYKLTVTDWAPELGRQDLLLKHEAQQQCNQDMKEMGNI